MVIDKLENLEKYVSLNPLFAQAVEFLKTTDLNAHEIGKVVLKEGELIVNFAQARPKTKEEAKNALKEITNFLDKSLELKLNKKTQIFKGKQGVNFCGYKINEYRMKLRDKGKRKLKKKVKKLTNQVYDGKISSKEAKKYLAGHMGYIKYADTYNLVNKLFYIENN